MNLILFGPPGSGKGTQAKMLAEAFNLRTVSTGEALRDAARRGTPSGLRAKEVMDRGELVSDDMVTDIVAEILEARRWAGNRFLFDGYPRTLKQVHDLDLLMDFYGLATPQVLLLRVPEEVLFQRMVHRRSVEARSDDTDETFRERQRTYRERTAPIVTEYARRGWVHDIDGLGTPEEVFARVKDAIRDHTGD
jgi:adenylate kinase